MGDYNSENLQKFPRGNVKTLKIELYEETEFLFLKIKKQQETELSQSNQQAKELIEKSVNEKQVSIEYCANESRYIPAEKRREALQKTHGRCWFPGCNKPFDVFHHPERFSIVKNHDNIVPLCTAHHEFAHNGLIENEKEDCSKWKLVLSNDIQPVDMLRRHRRAAALILPMSV